MSAGGRESGVRVPVAPIPFSKKKKILQNGIKVYIFLILRSSRFQISNLFLATTTLGVSRQKVASGVNFEPPFWIEVITGSGPFSIPLPTFSWTTWWKKNFSISIKIEGVTVPPHFLQNGGCDVTQMSFSKIEKNGTGKSLPDLKSQVALKSVQPFRR